MSLFGDVQVFASRPYIEDEVVWIRPWSSYLHLWVVGVWWQACGFRMRIRHAPQIACFRGKGIPISGTLHHRTSAFKLGANHQLKFGHKFFAQSLGDLNAVLVENVMISPLG